jgi:hypothetical protein
MLKRHLNQLIPILALLAVAACHRGTSGVQGNLIFSDSTQTVPPDYQQDIDQALAVGARMEIDVDLEAEGLQPRRDADIEVASSSNSAVFGVDSYSVGRVVVEGIGEGRAFLDVTTLGGTSDSIGIAVDPIASSEITLLPWPAALPLPQNLWDDGVVLLPDSPSDLFVMHRDAEGNDLTGHGAGTWEITAEVEATVTPKEGSDFATVRSGTLVETYALTTTAGGSFDLETVEESAVARLGIYNFTDGSGPFFDGETMQVDDGSTSLLHLVAYTEDDLYVIGAGTVPLDASIPSEGADVMRITLEPGSEEDADELNRMISNGRAFFAAAEEVGGTDLTVDWAEQTVTIHVLVRFNSNPQEDPEDPEEPEEEDV